MNTIVIQKIYKNSKTDKKGKPYTLVNMYTAKGVFTLFDYHGDANGWNEGDSVDISDYEQKDNEYNGKTSIILSRPSKQKQEVKGLEDRLNEVAKWAQSVEARLKKLEEQK
jgi:hypothetical protein